MVRGGIFNIGGRPRVIVVIAGTDREVLIGQLNLVRGYADIVELRLDLSMGLDLEWWSRVVRERGLVWMLTKTMSVPVSSPLVSKSMKVARNGSR